MHRVASRVTRVAASQTDSQIASGEPVYVYGIHVSNSSGGGQVVIERAGTTTVIMEIDLLAETAYLVDVTWLADGGLQVTTPANTTCTVFHSHPGV